MGPDARKEGQIQGTIWNEILNCLWMSETNLASPSNCPYERMCTVYKIVA